MKQVTSREVVDEIIHALELPKKIELEKQSIRAQLQKVINDAKEHDRIDIVLLRRIENSERNIEELEKRIYETSYIREAFKTFVESCINPGS